MSDTPGPIPSEALKPKLSLSPKLGAAPAAAPAHEPAPTSTVPTAHVTPPIMQSSSSTAMPPALAASTAPRQSLKLQGADTIHPANPDKFTDQKFASPMPVAVEGSSGVLVGLSALAAAAAITFAALLFLKTQ